MLVTKDNVKNGIKVVLTKEGHQVYINATATAIRATMADYGILESYRKDINNVHIRWYKDNTIMRDSRKIDVLTAADLNKRWLELYEEPESYDINKIIENLEKLENKL